MKSLSKSSLAFFRIWIASLLFFSVLGLLSFGNPAIDRMAAIMNALFLALLYSIILTAFLYTLYLFISLVADLFRKKESLNK
ncbi:MAG: hypothetical protein CVV24_01250 [Ignavibacteriae bacterium HGW-Ignavibacteriae-3]|nr:MAG: hypothetical protein CVV24_01250 [Ignavibacteriae bacterium HGW-Ignavibacteriae-3]